uniref:Uncharacterized protein n=1 Tax=Klebsiella pneumoniae TaxID=573 RepID=A0A2R4NE86_KLEPN|nr:hypothetical protein [Klebsiella pneumoniae]AVX34466.1 hypothetical protein [Klebsiella pneumoniae]AWF77149.1 hypothetical protein [Klebsiella pneumoniae]QFX77135.1 hypothetical protein [Klebsiella pneumoniae]QFX77467.1 hypothetical protein [Klebsiella pneumoniae]WRR55565.1 hypothetical protein VNK68_00130 [Klebsiella pneumoniae]
MNKTKGCLIANFATVPINLTGDYLWRSSAKIGAGKFRPLRPLQPA